MGDHERRLIRCHPKCMTSSGRDARMRPYVCLCVCGVVMLWNVNVNVYLINGVCVCVMLLSYRKGQVPITRDFYHGPLSLRGSFYLAHAVSTSQWRTCTLMASIAEIRVDNLQIKNWNNRSNNQQIHIGFVFERLKITIIWFGVNLWTVKYRFMTPGQTMCSMHKPVLTACAR